MNWQLPEKSNEHHEEVVETVAHFMPDKQRDPLIDHKGFLGRPLDRVDAQVKVKGEAPFTAEFQIPGVVHAVLVHSTIAKGKVSKIDTERAKSAGGVLEIFTYKNMPRLVTPPLVDTGDLKKGMAASDLPNSARLVRTLGRAADRRGCGADAGASRARRLIS